MTIFLDGVDRDRDRLLTRLDRVEALWDDARGLVTGADASGSLVADDLARIRADLCRQEFTIALFGLIKRGKSTLLNALLGGELSPTHVTPETAVPVHVVHGDEPRATVHLASGETFDVAPHEVRTWTSQKDNEANHRGVTHVRWAFPSPVLRHGVRVVDTPGLDDAEADELYTRRTIQELHAADAGVLVFMSPPTVGATEMAFLAQVAAADLRRTVLVANLYPQHFHDPEVREEVLDYVRTRIAEVTGASDLRLHAVCAEQAWEARRFGDRAGWVASGGADLLAAIEAVVHEHTGRRMLARAEAALERTHRIAAAAVDLRLRALTTADEDDPHERVWAHHQRLAGDGSDRLERDLAGVMGMRAQLQAIVRQSFLRARSAIHDAGTREELDAVLGRFAREVEVVTEDAFRQVHSRLMEVHAAADRAFDAGVSDTLHDLGAVLPGMRGRREEHAPPPPVPLVEQTTVRGAAVGGIVAGGAGFALLGVALGPIGLVAGAVAGWRLGAVVRRGRELQPLRDELGEELSAVAERVLAEFELRVESVVTSVRETARLRRAGFASDLGAVLDLMDRCPPGSAARADAIATLRRVARRLDGSETTAAVIDLDVARAAEDRDPLVMVRALDPPSLAASAPGAAVRGDGLEPPTLAL